MRVVLTGASGQLGSYAWLTLRGHGCDVRPWSGSTDRASDGTAFRRVDLADPGAIERAFLDDNPDAVLHAGAVSTVDGVRADPDRARRVNVEATARIACWCSEHGRRLVYTSTDLVFDGRRAWNREEDPAEPLLAYGRTKLEAEPSVLGCTLGLVARCSLLYGPSRNGRPTYLDRMLGALERGETQTFFEDEFRTPLDFETAAEALVGLLNSDATGRVHLAGRERLSRFEMARRVAVALGKDGRLISANRQQDAPAPEPRPADVSLDTARLATILPSLERLPVERAAQRLWLVD